MKLELPKTHIRLQRLQALFDLLLQEPRNAIRYEEWLLLTRCLDEARMLEIMQKEAIVKHVFYYYSTIFDSYSIDGYYSYFIDSYPGESNPQFKKIESIIKANPILVKSNRVLFEKFVLEKLIGYPKKLTDLIKLLSEKIIPRLLEELINTDKNVHYTATFALGKVGAQAPDKVTSELLEALKDKDSDVRGAAAKVLRNIGTQVLEEVIPLLLETLKNDKDEHVHGASAKTLENIGIQAPDKVIEALLEVLKKDTNWNARCDAAIALGEVGTQAPDKVIDALLEALKKADRDVRCAAAKGLREVRAYAPDKVIPALLEALNDVDYYVRDNAICALVKICNGKPDSNNIQQVAQALNNSFKGSERKKIISSILKEIKTIPLSFLFFCINELFSYQPPSILPSCLICSTNDIVKIDNKG